MSNKITVEWTAPSGLVITSEFRRAVVTTAAAIAHAKIVELVKANLRKTRADYLRGVQPPEINQQGTQAVIRLDGVFPNMIEQGWAGGDQRQWLIDKNPKKKIGKGGLAYAFIPFSHEAADMPVHVALTAAALSATKTAIGGSKTLWGASLKAGMAPKAKPHHATDLYAGMYRMEKTYRKATQSQLRTFRTISWASKTGWHHPGLIARLFLPQARDAVIANLDAIMKSAVAQAGS